MARVRSATDQQGIKVLGTLLLLHCASARANYQLRVVRPGLVESFAESHDQGLWRCLCAILEVPEDTCHLVTRATATLPLSLGGLGLRSAERTKVAACWASWADVLPMIQARHPAVAALMVQHLEGESWSPSMEAASRAATQLEGTAGLAGGLRPEQREPEDHEPGTARAGWQHGASRRVEQAFRASCLFPHMSPSERALVRSQSGPGAGVALLTSPSSPLTRIESPLFRVLLQRRLPLPLSERMCRCGHFIDFHGPTKTPPKFHEKTPREREKKKKMLWEKEKKREILGGPAEHTNLGPTHTGDTHSRHTHTQTGVRGEGEGENGKERKTNKGKHSVFLSSFDLCVVLS